MRFSATVIAFVKCNLLFASDDSEVSAGVAFAAATLVGFKRFKLAVSHLRFCFFAHLVIAW